MKPIHPVLWCLAATAAMLFQVSQAAAEEAPAATATAGQKLDSGLGELPHHRDWTDPTGKLPMRLEQRVAGSDTR